MSSEINIEELERLAKAATPGPWKACGTVEQIGGDCKDIIPTSVSCTAYCYGGSADRAEDKDLIFIAAANPFAVLSLIDRVKKAESDRDALAARLEMDPDHGIPDGIDCRNATIEMQDAQISALAAKLAELEGQEPVAWMTANREMTSFVNFHDDDLPLYARPIPADPVNAHLLTALIQCRDRFAFYVGHHLDKGDLEKAAENEKFVAIANDAISAAESAPKAVRLTGEEIIGIRQVLAGWDCNTPWSQTIALSRAIETAVLRKNGIEVAE